jgi:surface polysaccharide O-acyltransferase-like enzyme
VHTSNIAQKNYCTFLHYNYDFKKYLTWDAKSMSTTVTAQISTIISEAKKQLSHSSIGRYLYQIKIKQTMRNLRRRVHEVPFLKNQR